MTELDFIAALRTMPLHSGAQDLRDDVALLELGGETLVLTHDAIAEGVHYLPGTDAADIAWKLVAVNLSDLAAKGAEPLGVLIGASLGPESARFIEGLRDVLTEYGVPLLGGDTVSPAPDAPAMFGCTAVGRATCLPVPARSAARPGDGIWVCGTIGAAKLAFEAVSSGATREPWHDAYLRPVPLLSHGRAVAPQVHAMMDVSDGLLLDARRIAEASGCTLSLMLDAIPFPAQLGGESREARIAAASWGDDYALLFTAPPDFAPPVSAARIGSVLPAGAEPLLLDGVPPPGRLGYEHR